eukprot:jgi/Bigna1/76034/fgenesh1_pg.38_\
MKILEILESLCGEILKSRRFLLNPTLPGPPVSIGYQDKLPGSREGIRRWSSSKAMGGGCSGGAEAWEQVDDDEADDKIPNISMGTLSVSYLQEKFCLQKPHMRRLFQIYGDADTNGDGALDIEEFCGFMKGVDERKMGVNELKLFVQTLFDEYDTRRKEILLRKMLHLRNLGVKTENRHKQIATLGSKLGFSAFIYILCTFCTHSDRKLLDFEYTVFAGGPGQKLTVGKFSDICDRMHKMKHFEPALEKFEFEFGSEEDTPVTRKGWHKIAAAIPFLLWPVKNLQDVMRSRSLGFEVWSQIKKNALIREKKIRRKQELMIHQREGGIEKQYFSSDLNEKARAGMITLKKKDKVDTNAMGKASKSLYDRAKANYHSAKMFKNEKDWNTGLMTTLQSMDWKPNKEQLHKAAMGEHTKEIKHSAKRATTFQRKGKALKSQINLAAVCSSDGGTSDDEDETEEVKKDGPLKIMDKKDESSKGKNSDNVDKVKNSAPKDVGAIEWKEDVFKGGKVDILTNPTPEDQDAAAWRKGMDDEKYGGNKLMAIEHKMLALQERTPTRSKIGLIKPPISPINRKDLSKMKGSARAKAITRISSKARFGDDDL